MNPKTASIPLIFYTHQDEEIDRVVGFELGSMDYLSKRISARVVAHRIAAILKRRNPIPSDTLRIGSIVIDFNQSIAMQDGKRIALSPTEFQILIALIRAEGRVLGRKEIIAKVWHKEGEVMRRTVDVHVKSLRAKLAKYREDIQVTTVRGFGYSLRLKRMQSMSSSICNNESDAWRTEQ